MAVAIKSLQSFVGTVSNVTYRNFVLHDVNQAIMMNVYGQGLSDSPRVSSFHDITIENVSGTAAGAGKMLCDASITCRDITMRNVDLTITGKSSNGKTYPRAYQCSNVFGKAEGCTPVPCLTAESQPAALKTDDG